jgi:hypothetical protein
VGLEEMMVFSPAAWAVPAEKAMADTAAMKKRGMRRMV